MKTFRVTNDLLRQAYTKQDDDNLTPLRVQKLMYFLHGWYLAIVGRPLLAEPFIRGTYGPVLKSLEGELSCYGATPVDDYIKEWDDVECQVTAFFVDIKSAPQFADVLEQVWDQYAQYSTSQLSTLTHGDTSPWAMTRPGESIGNALIRDDFVRLAASNRAQQALCVAA